MIRSSYSGSLSQREENNGLSSAASRKPTWCLALRIIAWLHTNESERFHYVETETRSQAIELGGYRDTTFRRLKNSEEKYQFRKSASAVRKFSLARAESAEQIVTSERRCERQLSSSSKCYKSPLIVAAKWIRLDLAKRPGNRDKARCRKNAGEVGLRGGSFILPQSPRPAGYGSEVTP